MGRGIALLFHDHGTRRGWVVSSTPRLHFTPEKDPAPILQETGWAPGPVWTGGKSCPHRHSIPDRPARSQSLYRLSYPAHKNKYTKNKLCTELALFTRLCRDIWSTKHKMLKNVSLKVKVKQSRYRPRGFLEVKIPRLRNIGPGWW